MEKNFTYYFGKLITYYMICSNLLFPLLMLLEGDPLTCLSISEALTTIVWMLSGLLLLYGTIEGKERYIPISVLLTTGCLFVAPIYVVFNSSNKIFCQKQSTRTIFLLITYFVLMWPMQFYVYLFYKKRAKSSEAQKHSTEEESVVCTCGELTKENQELLPEKTILNII